MELTFNANAKSQRIDSAYNDAVEKIKANMAAGVRDTELYIDKDIASDVRERLDENIVTGKQFTWATVRRGVNQFTGRAESFTSDTFGNERYYKLRYFGN